MATEVFPGIKDDNDFIALFNSMVKGLLEKQSPDQLWIIQIDNWFDHKWLEFSGKGIVDFNWHGLMGRFDAALDEFNQDKLTFPPFNPNRVLSQWSFMRVGEQYSEVPLSHLPHPTAKQGSNANLIRRVENAGRSALYVWYSANTFKNGRASVIAYSVLGEKVDAWFAAFKRKDRWLLQATKGANRDDVQKLVDGR